jgi:hypothetical protein
VNEKLSPAERRRAYRVRPETIDEFDLAIVGPAQELVRAVINDVAAGGACIRIDRATALAFIRDERIVIAVASRRFRYADEFCARIVALRPDQETVTVHLKFENERPFPEGPIHAVLNRRNEQRESHDETGLHAEVASNHIDDHLLRTHDVEVRHISNVGVSLRLGASAHAALRATDGLMLTLRLPDRDERCRVACVVRHRYADGHHYVYSCEYDWTATNDPLGVIEDLVAFVLERGSAVGLR